ncbi:MAG: hypothetical protein U0166_05780 [Acidobacteriota bacterium]
MRPARPRSGGAFPILSYSFIYRGAGGTALDPYLVNGGDAQRRRR